MGISFVGETGRFVAKAYHDPAKAAAGEAVPVSADIFRDGHDILAARVRGRPVADPAWREAPLYRGAVSPTQPEPKPCAENSLRKPVPEIVWTEADELAAVPPPELPGTAGEVSIRH